MVEIEEASAPLLPLQDSGTLVEEGDDEAPPTSDSELLQLSQGVTKQILKAGQEGEDAPTDLDTCFVHYRAWSFDPPSHSKFEDTWEQQQPQKLVPGREKKEQRGLALGLCSMAAGEVALLHVPPELGYGPQGSFSFPHVPPGARLVYEVELLGFDKGAGADRTADERIVVADQRRQRGNEAFREGDNEGAIRQYNMALCYLDDDFMMQMFGKYKEMADAVRLPCHLNLAATCLRMENHQEAVTHCSIVLAEDSRNVKALFRRGKARVCLGQSEAARVDLERASQLAPDDVAVRRELQRLLAEEKRVSSKQRQLYKGMFQGGELYGDHPVASEGEGGEGWATENRAASWLLLLVQWIWMAWKSVQRLISQLFFSRPSRVKLE